MFKAVENLREQKGFTLIELLIVIAIIGILAAIAIPQFAAYRTRSYNSAAQSDLKNAATAQEAYYIDYNTYATNVNELTGTSGGFYQTADVDIQVNNANTNAYNMTSNHTSGNITYNMIGPGGTIKH